MSEKVEICRKEGKGYKIEEDVYYKDGMIVFDGWHFGGRVEDTWGDSDIEYWVKIPEESIPILKRKLWVWWMSPDRFLRYLARRFKADNMFSEVREFLEKHDIEHDWLMWV